jgi:hypothetical protein
LLPRSDLFYAESIIMRFSLLTIGLATAAIAGSLEPRQQVDPVADVLRRVSIGVGSTITSASKESPMTRFPSQE